ncbi:MAG: GFA family protein [Solimonas sp.]
MSETSLHGGCLCGAVTYTVDPPFQRMVHCHCSRCRKGTGTGHATNLIVDQQQFRWLGGETLIARFDLESAKSFGKWFCGRCGSPLPRLRRNGTVMVIPAGSLDDTPPLQPSDRIFWSSRAEWSCGAGGLPVHDEYPPTW